MRIAGRLSCYLAISATILLAAVPALAQEQQAASTSTAPISVVVTVLGPKYTAPPAVGKDDISVYEGKTKRDVTDWVPAQGDKASLQLAILIDDVISPTEIGNQLNDLREFIQSQPNTTSVGVFYASNGTIQAASQFSTEHAAVAKSVRMPIGNGGAFTSTFLSLMDLFKRWPVTGARREVLVIADGIDRFRGDPFSPDVDSTIARAETAGIMVHTLYAQGTGRVFRNTFRVSWGQSNLGKMADETGGEAFFQGLSTPISFSPFLKQLDMVLKNQYLLTYETKRSTKKKGELRQFRVRTELRNVDISAADRAFVPGQ
ncbi:MAG: hypothetical protein ACRD4S_05895 [Candidatus Acidiferrales bacterium]